MNYYADWPIGSAMRAMVGGLTVGRAVNKFPVNGYPVGMYSFLRLEYGSPHPHHLLICLLSKEGAMCHGACNSL